jgi:uncharacterized protein YdaU (DUF1376 family)
MKGMYYFDHDNNAHNDDKMRKIRRQFGSAGYGKYWLLLELMHNNNGCIERDDLEDIAYWEQIENIEEFVEYCINIKLFIEQDGKIYSKRMVEDIQAFVEQQDKRQSAANQRWNKRTDDKTPKGKGSNNNKDNNSDNKDNNKDINKEETQTGILPENINNVIETLSKDDMQAECKCNANADEVNMQNEKVDVQAECTCNANANQNKKEKNKINNNKINNNKINNNNINTANAVVVDVSSPQSQSVSDCDGLQNMSNEQIAGAMALLDSLDIDVASPPLEVSAEDINSILIDEDAAFDPDDNVIDYDTQQQQEADKATSALLDDQAKMRDTLIQTYAITDIKAEIILARHDVAYIQSKIDLLQKQKNIDNPGAWLIKAIENDYQAAVPEEKPQQLTASYSDMQYDNFCEHFKQVFNQDFTHKALYENAVSLLGTSMKVDYLLSVISDYKGNPRIKEILTVNHCHGFSDVMKSESAMGELIGFGMAQSSKDMADKIKELPWMNKQGA